jgi:hypothetical protein
MEGLREQCEPHRVANCERWEGEKAKEGRVPSASCRVLQRFNHADFPMRACGIDIVPIRLLCNFAMCDTAQTAQICRFRIIGPSGASGCESGGVMARYIARSRSIEYSAELEFDDWVSARRYAHGHLKGSVVEITDNQPGAGQPSSYIVTAGRTGLVRIRPGKGSLYQRPQNSAPSDVGFDVGRPAHQIE